MQIYRIDALRTIEENISALLDDDDLIAMKYPVVLLDHPVVDRTTPHIYISNRKFIITYDEAVEVYELSNLEIGFTGEFPVFTVIQQLLESRYRYDNEFQEDYEKMRASEPLLKMSIFEAGQIPKDILFRDGIFVKRSYQNWAIGTIIRNHQHNIESNLLLYKMQDSLFFSFNTKTVLTFSILTIIYFLIRLLLVPSVPDLIGTIFDVVYSLLLMFMGVWLVLTLKNNLERYHSVFQSYTLEEDHLAGS